MPYCSKCGYEVKDGESFCENCGTTIRINGSKSKCIEVFDGKVHKCSRCGEVIDSFQTHCPTCGYELRDTAAADSISKLSFDLRRAYTEDEKVQIIRTFPIPNGKEDIYEFMFMAESNFDAKKYAENRSKDTLDAAWLAKIEQSYNKARMAIKDRSEILPIEELYNKAKQRAAQAESERDLIRALPYICLIAGSALCLVDIKYIQYAGAILLIVGIVMFCMRKSKTEQVKTNTPFDPFGNQPKDGFSSWSSGKKAGWIILNIYTMGIPAIIYWNNRRK